MSTLNTQASTSPDCYAETLDCRHTFPRIRDPPRSWQSSFDGNSTIDVAHLVDQLTKHLRESQKDQFQFLENSKDKNAERVLQNIIEMKDEELWSAKRMSMAWKDDVVAINEQRYQSELGIARKREEDGLLAAEKLREELGNKEKEIRELVECLKSMETQKLKAKEEGDKEKERLGKGLLAKDREIRALQTGMGVKRQEIAKLERNGDSLRNNVERMEKERAALCKKVECEEKQNKELNDTMLSQEIEIQGLRRKLVSKTEIAKEMETKVKELKTKVGKWKAHTTTLLSCLREEEQRSWSKLPITGSLYHYLGSWYSSDKSVVTATEALKGFLRSEGLFI